MSDLDLGREQHRRAGHKRGLGCLAVLVALAILGGGGYLAYSTGLSALENALRPPPDYSGAGSGSVTVEVRSGDSSADIAGTLAGQDVVKSAEAFTDAASKDPESMTIQAGYYQMKKQMSAEAALAILIDPGNVIRNPVTIPEGWTVDQIVAALAKKSKAKAGSFTKVLEKPGSIGLPDYAQGNPEGYLFPATYELPPRSTPRQILTMMVKRYDEAATSTDLEAEADKLGYSAHDVMTVASLIQSEARLDKDFAKVSRVIYNRLDEGMKLQFDSTVHYAVGKTGSVSTTGADRNVDSPYNTYKKVGLPPTPISAPGEQAIEAALNPAEGSWMYFVTVNPDSGETKFATDYQDHLKNVQEFQKFCQGSDKC